MAAVDISNFAPPRLLGEMELAEHPGFVIGHKGLAFVPGGYQGLLAWNRRLLSFALNDVTRRGERRAGLQVLVKVPAERACRLGYARNVQPPIAYPRDRTLL